MLFQVLHLFAHHIVVVQFNGFVMVQLLLQLNGVRVQMLVLSAMLVVGQLAFNYVHDVDLVGSAVVGFGRIVIAIHDQFKIEILVIAVTSVQMRFVQQHRVVQVLAFRAQVGTVCGY